MTVDLSEEYQYSGRELFKLFRQNISSAEEGRPFSRYVSRKDVNIEEVGSDTNLSFLMSKMVMATAEET